jgi:hypothetical protein
LELQYPKKKTVSRKGAGGAKEAFKKNHASTLCELFFASLRLCAKLVFSSIAEYFCTLSILNRVFKE